MIPCSNQICQSPTKNQNLCDDCAAMNKTDPWANRNVVFVDPYGDTLSEQEYGGFNEPDFVDPQVSRLLP